MKPEDSLPCLQKPARGLYSEPYESSPHPTTHLTSLGSILILSSHLGLGLPSGLIYSDFEPKYCMPFLPSLNLHYWKLHTEITIKLYNY